MAQITTRQVRGIKFKEGLFKWVMSNSALFNILLLSAILVTLFIGSLPAIKVSTYHFLVDTTWDPITNRYGALPFLAGTPISV